MSHPSKLAALQLVASVALLVACDGPSGKNGGDVHGGEGSVIATPRDGGASNSGEGGSDGATAGDAGGGTGISASRRATIAACEACEKSQCSLTSPTASDDYGSATGGIDFYALCFDTPGNATQGPAMGVSLAQLCEAVLDCVHLTGCAVTSTGLSTSNSRVKNLDCYCGADVSAGACMSPGNANGPCKTAIENAAGTVDPQKITANYTNPYFPSDDPSQPQVVNPAGAALGLVYYCESDVPPPAGQPLQPSVCTQTCLQPAETDGGASDAGEDATGGQSGTAGAGANGAAGAGCGPGGGGNTTGSASLCGTTTDDACEACELATDPGVVPTCDPVELTANPATVDSSGNSWGFGTLPTLAQQSAARALFEAIVATIKPGSPTGCASNTTNTGPGDDPQIGCLGSPGAGSLAILGGAIGGPLAQDYKNAAIADGLLDAEGHPLETTSSDQDFASAIASVTSTPTSAIGLADNLFRCAFYLENSGTPCLAFVQGTGLTGDCAGATGVATCASTDAGVDASTGSTASPCGGGRGAGAAGMGTAGASGAAGSASGTAGVGSSAGASGSAGATGSAGARGDGVTCPDLDGDGVPDCQQTLVSNPSFDQSTASWTAESGSTAGWTSLDANGSSSSGAIAVTNVDTNPAHASNGSTTAGASQCLAVVAGSSYEVAVQAFLRSGQGSGWAGFVLEEYFAPGCAGAPWSVPFLSPQLTATDAWRTIIGTTTQIPLGIAAIAVRLVAVKPPAQPSLEALFDNVLVRVK
jgi:hypothetical protein